MTDQAARDAEIRRLIAAGEPTYVISGLLRCGARAVRRIRGYQMQQRVIPRPKVAKPHAPPRTADHLPETAPPIAVAAPAPPPDLSPRVRLHLECRPASFRRACAIGYRISRPPLKGKPTEAEPRAYTRKAQRYMAWVAADGVVWVREEP